MNKFEPPELHLAAWRKNAGLTQEQLAHKIGYSRGHIANSEVQTTNVTLQFLTAYAEGVSAPSVPALFSKPDAFNPTLAKLQQYFLQIEQPEQRDAVVNVAKGLSEQYAGAAIETEK